jgi:hypothetical protein
MLWLSCGCRRLLRRRRGGGPLGRGTRGSGDHMVNTCSRKRERGVERTGSGFLGGGGT